LRLLQTVDDVAAAAEKNSTRVMPLPVELLRSFDRATTSTVRGSPGDPHHPDDRHRNHHDTNLPPESSCPTHPRP
jgi:hypothetical protein